jgi:hypothetical protein
MRLLLIEGILMLGEAYAGCCEQGGLLTTTGAEDRREGESTLEMQPPDENRITFQQADRQYAELNRERQSGALSEKDFSERLRELMVQDDEDRYWAKSPRTGEWHRWDPSGNRWIKDTPPGGYEPPPPPPPPPATTDAPPTTTDSSTLRGAAAGTASSSAPPPPPPSQPPPQPPTSETQQPPPSTAPPPVAAAQRRGGLSRKLLVVGGLVGVLGVLLIAGVLVIVAVVGTGGTTAPELEGKTEGEAEREVGNDYEVYVREVRVADAPEGTIISQEPEAGEVAEEGSTISVVVSAGKPPKPGDIFEDDFSDTSSGWDVDEGTGEEVWILEYALGGYRIYNPPPDTNLVGLNEEDAGTAIGDAVIEVDATPVSGGIPEKEDAGLGVMCRVLDYDNYYSFGIHGDGHPAIFKQKNGEWDELASGPPTDAFKGGNTTNRLRADCVGSNLTLYVNGQKVLEAQDSDFQAGQVGLFAQDDGGKGIEILFDNFLVSSP